MIGTLTKLKDGWYVNYFDIHTYLRLHPEDENLSYAVRDSAWEGKKVNFEVVVQEETSEHYAKLIPSKQKEISDEEIEKAAESIESGIHRMFFKTGAKWYREQLKQK
jgi:hypothetical protein